MEKLRIILLGQKGAGKSASGNALLGCHSFHTAVSSKPVTRACSVSFTTVDEQIIEVIDTPGWCDSPQFETEMKPNIINHIHEYKPHVFLLVLPIGRFTDKEINTVMNILEEFGDEVNKYMIVLFTREDDLENKTIEDYLKEAHTDLKKIIRICGERYHVFNNRERKDRTQISCLLKKINDLVEKNKVMKRSMYEENKTGQKREENIKSPAENEKSHDDQGSSCDTDGNEKERGEPLVDRKEIEMFKNEVLQTFQDLTKNIQELTEKIQFMERQIMTMQEEHGKIKKELQPVQ